MCDSCNSESAHVCIKFEDGDEFWVCLDCASLAEYGREVSVLDTLDQIRVWLARSLAVT